MGLIFDGVDLKQRFGFIAQDISGRGSPPITTTDFDMPDIDGAIELSRKAGIRKVSVKGMVYDAEPATARSKKDNLIRLLTTAYSEDKKLLFSDTERFLYVKLASDPFTLGPYGPIFNATVYEVTFAFEAREPWFFGEAHGVEDIIINSGRIQADAPEYIASPKTRYIPNEPYVTAYGLFFGNILGNDGRDMVENTEITFDTISGHVYYETANKKKFTAVSASTTLLFEGAQSVEWDTDTAATKDIMVIDLTAIGVLPPPVTQKFGVVKAENLSEAQLSVLINDYHDGWNDEDFNITTNTTSAVSWDTGSALTQLQREV